MDPVRVRQVLTNLIGNAIKFTEDGTVTIRSKVYPQVQDHAVTLEVSIIDTGIGFDPSRLQALFSPFTQADGSITRSYGGTGLGLAITRSLMQLMGGDVTAVSKEGQGARFTISWPVKRVSSVLADTEQQHPIQSEAETYPSTRPMAVLLVEDHEINRKLAQIMLQRMGHSFVLAKDGQEALDCLDKERFDVVLLDVMMPVMDGITALKIWRARAIERQLPRTTVLMVTAHAMTGDRERFIAAGADGYVSKPISEVALRKEINRTCFRSA
jgi:CheY-like chemotaxis protein/anti-sigma regulatory factor (Ser/Thr protein kinase)